MATKKTTATTKAPARKVKTPAKANPSVAKPMVEVSPDAKKPNGFYKLASTPRGTALFTYMVGALMAIDRWDTKRKVFQKKELTQFFRTGTAYSHHKKAGNFEETKTGVRLTTAGWNYFNGRLTGSTVGQRVHEPEAKAIAVAMKTGKLADDTAHFAKSTAFVPIKE